MQGVTQSWQGFFDSQCTDRYTNSSRCRPKTGLLRTVERASNPPIEGVEGYPRGKRQEMVVVGRGVSPRDLAFSVCPTPLTLIALNSDR